MQRTAHETPENNLKTHIQNVLFYTGQSGPSKRRANGAAWPNGSSRPEWSFAVL